MKIMNLDKKIVDRENNYTIGYSKELQKYILAAVVTHFAWYDRYYEITKEEYDSYGTQAFDDLVISICYEGEASDRFLFSDKIEENNAEQQALKHSLHNKK